MHSGGFELTKLTYTRPEDNLIRHRGDRLIHVIISPAPSYRRVQLTVDTRRRPLAEGAELKILIPLRDYYLPQDVPWR